MSACYVSPLTYVQECYSSCRACELVITPVVSVRVLTLGVGCSLPCAGAHCSELHSEDVMFLKL